MRYEEDTVEHGEVAYHNPVATVVPGIEDRRVARTTVLPANDAANGAVPEPVNGLDQMRTRMIVRHSPTIGKLALALSKAQGEFTEIVKTKTAKVSSAREGARSYEYDYETLADVLRAVRPALSKNELAVMQFPFAGEKSMTVRTFLVHGEEWIYNDLTCSIFDTSPQTLGSAMAYLKRYALKSIVGVAAEDEDDDGAAAMAAPAPATRREAPQASVRKSEAAAAVVAPAPGPVGEIASVDETERGAIVKLSNGYRAATRDAEIIKSAKAFAKTSHARVELITQPSSNPEKFLPLIIEIKLKPHA